VWHLFYKINSHVYLRHRIQIGSGTHPVSYEMDIGGKTARAWSWPLTSI